MDIDFLDKKLNKKIYLYEKVNGKKDRKKGIIKSTKLGFEMNPEPKDWYLKANFIEILFYCLFSSPFSKLSGFWSSLNTDQKIKIIGIMIGSILTLTLAIIGWIYFKN